MLDSPAGKATFIGEFPSEAARVHYFEAVRSGTRESDILPDGTFRKPYCLVYYVELDWNNEDACQRVRFVRVVKNEAEYQA